MKELLNELIRQIESGNDTVMATIVASSGSTPRGTGARMLVGRTGRLCGTVGGGAVEHESEKLALQALREQASRIRDFRLSPNQVADIGMICGGEVTIFLQYIDAGDKKTAAVVRHAIERIEKGESAWLITDTTEGTGGSLGIYSEKEGFFGLDNPPEGITEMMTGRSRQQTFGDRTYYVEQLFHAGTVYIFGGGHVAQELVPLLSHVGFRCVVLDDREAFVSAALFPDAARTILIDFADPGSTLRITEDDYIAIMTRGHINDTSAQAFALRTSACYIGVMGSAAKRAAVAKKMEEMGFAPSDLERVTSPIGLPIRAETPAEIAVSIAAQLIQKRAERGSR